MSVLTKIYADIDECSENTHNCDQHARCEDTEGDFECSCRKGYYGDGTFCEGKFI